MDRTAFLEALAKTKERYPLWLFGYCLMTNHFQLPVRPGRCASTTTLFGNGTFVECEASQMLKLGFCTAP